MHEKEAMQQAQKKRGPGRLVPPLIPALPPLQLYFDAMCMLASWSCPPLPHYRGCCTAVPA